MCAGVCSGRRTAFKSKYRVCLSPVHLSVCACICVFPGHNKLYSVRHLSCMKKYGVASCTSETIKDDLGSPV